MLRFLALASLLATLPFAYAQSADPASQAPPENPQAPAPIVRHRQADGLPSRSPHRQQFEIVESQPVAGIWLRSESANNPSIISATPQRTEVRLARGRLNVNVHQPAQHSEILIDLPGGQVSLLKDGLYTFNADTNTVRVLRGEAAFLGVNADIKPIKIKEDHQLSLIAAPGLKPGDIRSVEAYPYELTADLLPDTHGEPSSALGYAEGYGYSDGPDYPRNEYPYPYPYYAWGYPGFYPGYFGYGYPFGYGIGFGYYGFHGGYGLRGGFRR